MRKDECKMEEKGGKEAGEISELERTRIAEKVKMERKRQVDEA